MTPTQLKEWFANWLDEKGLEPRNVDEFTPYSWSSKKGNVEHEGLTLILVDENGGCEGGGEHADKTFAVAPDGSTEVGDFPGTLKNAVGYLYFEGYYESHSGTEWDGDVYVVEPSQTLVTVYKTIE